MKKKAKYPEYCLYKLIKEFRYCLGITTGLVKEKGLEYCKDCKFCNKKGEIYE